MPATYQELREAADKAWAPVDKPQRPLIKAGVATCSRVVGAEETLKALRDGVTSRKLEADVLLVGCNGLCYAEPLVEVQLPGRSAVIYQQLTADRVPALAAKPLAERFGACPWALYHIEVLTQA
jgi:NADH-quinone oxidoreductase subunit F